MTTPEVAVAPNADDEAATQQPVQEGGHDLAAEDPAPLLEALVRREHGRGVSVPAVDEREKPSTAISAWRLPHGSWIDLTP